MFNTIVAVIYSDEKGTVNLYKNCFIIVHIFIDSSLMILCCLFILYYL